MYESTVFFKYLAIAFKPLIPAKFASKMYFGLTCMHEKVVDINPYGLRVRLRTQSMCILFSY